METLTHAEATRRNIPTTEYQSVLQQERESPVRVAYARRNRDLDPQLVWRRKDEQDWSDLVACVALVARPRIRNALEGGSPSVPCRLRRHVVPDGL